MNGRLEVLARSIALYTVFRLENFEQIHQKIHIHSAQ